MVKHLGLAVLCLLCVPTRGLCQGGDASVGPPALLDGGLPLLTAEVASLSLTTIPGTRVADGARVDIPYWSIRVHAINRSECEWAAVSQMKTELNAADGTLMGELHDIRYEPNWRPRAEALAYDPSDFCATIRFRADPAKAPPAAIYLALLRYRAKTVGMQWIADGAPLKFPLKTQTQGLWVTITGLSAEDIPVPGKDGHEQHAVLRLTGQRRTEDICPRPTVDWGGGLALAGVDGKLIAGQAIETTGGSTPVADGQAVETYSTVVHFAGADLPVIGHVELEVNQWRRVPSLAVTCPLPPPTTE